MLDRLFLGDSVPTDPNFENVTLLLHGDGSNGKQNNTFLDSSTNNFTITRNGGVTQGSFSPFTSKPYDPAINGGSGYFDGSGDYLEVPVTNGATTIGTGDFTLEFWVYYQGGSRMFYSGPTHPCVSFEYYGGTLNALYSWSAWTLRVAYTFQANAWTHLALTRASGVLRLFANGVQIGSVSNSTNLLGGTAGIAQIPGGYGYELNGFISNLRFIKGTAVYTTNFTPPTAPVTAITNTSLLLNFTNAGIVDASAKNDLVTIGNAQISTSVKKYGTGAIYAPSASYAVAPQASVQLGSADFTIEFWLNTNDAGINNGIFAVDALLGYDYAGLVIGGSGLAVTNNGGTWQILNFSAFGAIDDSTWRHIAVVRNGSNILCFNNGVLQSTNAFSGAIFYKGPAVVVGKKPDLLYGPTTCYIDDLRITKGVARYTGNFTPPTAAFADQ